MSGHRVEGGIVVAPIKTAELITGQDIPLEVLQEYVENAKSMSQILQREVFLGGWFNTADNQYYLDNVLIVDDKVEALYIADAAEQIAIFDPTYLRKRGQMMESNNSKKPEFIG